MKKYSFPVLSKIKISHFDLYKKADFLEIDLSKNVFCLAGANGLGKSTFITIVNYGLTGIVRNPNRDFTWYNSISAFYNKSKGFAADYFDGRVSGENFELAEVSLEFTIDQIEYKITRGFFEPDELRFFSKRSKGKLLKLPQYYTNSELNDLFKTNFTADVGLSDFDQFVFLQCFLFTFDETHQLLFWNESLIERVLYLFFGVDANKAKLADQLRKDYNKFDSEVRNLQFQITRTRSQIKDIQKSSNSVDINDTSNIELFETHKSLQEESDKYIQELESISLSIKEEELKIANQSLRASSLRSEYEILFNQTLTVQTQVEKNPNVIKILRDLQIRIFAGNNVNDLLEKLVSTIKEHQKKAKGKTSKGMFSKLKEIDNQLLKASNAIKASQSKIDKYHEREKAATSDLSKINSKIQTIEKDNSELLVSLQNLKSNNGLHQLLKSFKETIEQISTQKEEALRKRKKASQELEPLEAELNRGYLDAEADFIPMFNQYAKSFLGLDINIDLAINTKGASLSLLIDNTKRKVSYQLSESQRYFVDIAIRMALIELCTRSATLLIDTPEGSLDIAYESRAGKMFADFAKGPFNLIMTANINSSELLLELASICRKRRMQIERMTEWTTLSEVQQKESRRLERAYSQIEKILNAK